MRQITFTKKFEKQYKKLTNSQKNNVDSAVELFIIGTEDAKLRIHKLKHMKNKFSFSAEYDLRIIYTIEKNVYKLYVLETIGKHDEVY
jgi:mRNA-degrading endonuclease YafQ of YafQ-DinJ toxin-antitoxin module